MVMESRDLANERQRIAGSGDGVLARLCCRVVTEMVLLHPGWLRCFNVAWLQRNQQISGRDFSQCVTSRNVWPIGEVRLDCDGHTNRYDH
jgi:hypothetical protein